VNTVVGFIGPEYLYDGKQIIRAGLEDHFCGKLLGLPMGCDICYTNHAEADSDDMDTLLTLLGAAGVNFIMGVPGADDIMLNYQSTSFHDALYCASCWACAVRPTRPSSLNVLREHLLRLPSPHLSHTPLRLGPVVVASQARVALGDDIAQALHAPMVAMLIGERPGLSSPDSVGIYLTLNPKVGCHDAQRNCISNVRPEGQPFASAAYRLAWLVQQAFKLGSTGVTLKDESDLAALDASAPALEPHT
jgi:hypothetical protein